ncbi:predicted protein [Plenodomus lingam JN3]|uniref:Predicted protein n=1 Tax=Leptosphaeria maculans (strain JN3 / isolate v23.1.3 / race Av1-4-5-6-7-8) TaxID=985895 RepID=E5A0F0_LEPMJ|nr:predicted protein [Plenodomus lingam JN3]CBX97010.1 predicted protein [Plenodomus lingam JN3]
MPANKPLEPRAGVPIAPARQDADGLVIPWQTAGQVSAAGAVKRAVPVRAMSELPARDGEPQSRASGFDIFTTYIPTAEPRAQATQHTQHGPIQHGIPNEVCQGDGEELGQRLSFWMHYPPFKPCAAKGRADELGEPCENAVDHDFHPERLSMNEHSAIQWISI